jgi:hypothetical protein
MALGNRRLSCNRSRIVAILSGNWRDAYTELQDFIAANPQIGIEKSSVSIPADVRGEFYRLFDTVTKTFVEERYSPLPVEAEALSTAYNKLAKEMIELLCLDGISMPTSLDSFLHSPTDGLMRTLFDSLFDLLQGKVDFETFERVALKKLDASVIDLSRWGYEIWVALSLVRLLEPDQAFQIVLDSEERTVLKELESISIGHQFPHPTLRLPEFVVHSHRNGKYVSVKFELATEMSTYTTASKPERKQAMQNAGDTSNALGHRILVMSTAERPEDSAILADLKARRIFPPDVVVECQEQDGATLDGMKRYHDILQPRRGTYVVFRETVPEMSLQPPNENIHPLTGGFDRFRLQPIIETVLAPRQE